MWIVLVPWTLSLSQHILWSHLVHLHETIITKYWWLGAVIYQCSSSFSLVKKTEIKISDCWCFGGTWWCLVGLIHTWRLITMWNMIWKFEDYINTFWKAVDIFQGFLQKENKIVFMKVQSIKIFFLLFSIAGPVHESLIIESLINCLVKHVSDCWLFSRSLHGWLTEACVATKVIPE